MEQANLDKFKKFFADYIVDFYGDDKFVNDHLQLKEVHTARVCDEINYLTKEGKFSLDDKLLAETIAIFHDVGRFPQFVEYRTYHDPISCNHSQLSIQVLRESEILSCLPDDEQKLVIKAIALHSVKDLPGQMDTRLANFAKLIRDADKLDIYKLLIENYHIYHADPENFNFDIEMPDEPWYTDEIMECATKGRLIDYGKLETLNDVKILKVGWVHDINFPAALKKIKEQGYIDELINLLPQDQAVENLRTETFKYMDKRIAEGI